MEVRFTLAASKHGISETSIMDVLYTATIVLPLDDIEMYLGADRSGLVLEVGVVFEGEDRMVVIHAMEMREQFRPDYEGTR